MKLGMQVGLGPGYIVLDGDPAPPPPKGHSPHPIFGPYLLQPNGCMDQDAMELGLSQGVLDGDPALPSSKKGAEPPPQFSAHFYCDQTAACIKMPLGMEVDLSPGDFVLDRDPAPPLNFRPMFIIVIVISLEHCRMHSRLVCSRSSFSILCVLF